MTTEVFRNGFDVTPYHSGQLGALFNYDAVIFLASLRSGVADIVFIDPPFNLGKDYGSASEVEKMSEVHYEKYMVTLLRQAIRVLKPGGALYVYHLPFWASRLSSQLHKSLEFRHWIAISMKNGFARGRRLYPAHYALLYFTKGEPSVFCRPRLEPVVCRKCGAQLRDYGGYKTIIAEKGVNLSDFWDDLSPVRHPSRKHRLANQLPLTLTDRITAISGSPLGLLVDPFVGTGTSLVSASNRSMRYLGNDLDTACLDISITRLPDPARQLDLIHDCGTGGPP